MKSSFGVLNRSFRVSSFCQNTKQALKTKFLEKQRIHFHHGTCSLPLPVLPCKEHFARPQHLSFEPRGIYGMFGCMHCVHNECLLVPSRFDRACGSVMYTAILWKMGVYREWRWNVKMSDHHHLSCGRYLFDKKDNCWLHQKYRVVINCYVTYFLFLTFFFAHVASST